MKLPPRTVLTFEQGMDCTYFKMQDWKKTQPPYWTVLQNGELKHLGSEEAKNQHKNTTLLP